MFLLSGPLIYRVSGKCAVLCAVPLTYSLLTSWSIYSTKHLKRLLHRTLGASIASLWRLFGILLPQKSPYETFKTRGQEDAYWRDAEAGQRELSSSDARLAKGSRTEEWNSRNEKHLVYYTPRLLPEYRDKRRGDYELDFRLPSKTVVEWHRLVFPGKPTLTFLQASQMLCRFSPKDLREIYRILRRAGPNGEKITKAQLRASPDRTCERLWKDWLERKPPELVICFEEGDP